ncbi:hypothetical protein AA313_de0207381 [Arthrobotrys entomopaga]|nr:hypothetical protein AA313_de0207381 [Arthrobotrys entomopaga]
MSSMETITAPSEYGVRQLEYQSLYAGNYQVDDTIYCHYPQYETPPPIVLSVSANLNGRKRYLKVTFTSWSGFQCEVTIPLAKCNLNLVTEKILENFRHESPPPVISKTPMNMLEVKDNLLILRGCTNPLEEQVRFIQDLVTLGAMNTNTVLDPTNWRSERSVNEARFAIEPFNKSGYKIRQREERMQQQSEPSRSPTPMSVDDDCADENHEGFYVSGYSANGLTDAIWERCIQNTATYTHSNKSYSAHHHHNFSYKSMKSTNDATWVIRSHIYDAESSGSRRCRLNDRIYNTYNRGDMSSSPFSDRSGDTLMALDSPTGNTQRYEYQYDEQAQCEGNKSSYDGIQERSLDIQYETGTEISDSEDEGKEIIQPDYQVMFVEEAVTSTHIVHTE